MNIPLRKKAMILTQRIVAGHQIACILENHGWSSISTHHSMKGADIAHQNPGMLVIDVTGNLLGSLELLHEFRRTNRMAYLVALCKGGNSPAMRSARNIGVDGFFYLNSSELALDPTRGMAPIFLRSRPSAAQSGPIPGSTLNGSYSSASAPA